MEIADWPTEVREAVYKSIGPQVLEYPDGGRVTSKRGLLMGLPFAWPALCVINAFCAERSQATHWEVCGDDLLAVLPRTGVDCYNSMIESLGLSISWSKHFTSSRFGVFTEELYGLGATRLVPTDDLDTRRLVAVRETYQPMILLPRIKTSMVLLAKLDARGEENAGALDTIRNISWLVKQTAVSTRQKDKALRLLYRHPSIKATVASRLPRTLPLVLGGLGLAPMSRPERLSPYAKIVAAKLLHRAEMREWLGTLAETNLQFQQSCRTVTNQLSRLVVRVPSGSLPRAQATGLFTASIGKYTRSLLFLFRQPLRNGTSSVVSKLRSVRTQLISAPTSVNEGSVYKNFNSPKQLIRLLRAEDDSGLDQSAVDCIANNLRLLGKQLVVSAVE
jgi:hypothetical protein